MIAEAILCLALVGYHEARGEPIEGRIAATFVPLNRAKKNKTSICWEVFKPHQFAWTDFPGKRKIIPHGWEWDSSVKIAELVYNGEFWDITKGADHFDTTKPPPKWAKGMTKTGTWGHHTFYRSKP